MTEHRAKMPPGAALEGPRSGEACHSQVSESATRQRARLVRLCGLYPDIDKNGNPYWQGWAENKCILYVFPARRRNSLDAEFDVFMVDDECTDFVK